MIPRFAVALIALSAVLGLFSSMGTAGGPIALPVLPTGVTSTASPQESEPDASNTEPSPTAQPATTTRTPRSEPTSNKDQFGTLTLLSTEQPPMGTHTDCSVVKCVALTFDDGPAKRTTELVDYLVARNVPATFFVIGRSVATYPQTVQYTASQPGMVIANHTWSHPSLTSLSSANVSSQLSRTTAVIKQYAGTTPQYMRPPGGAVNDRVRSVVGSNGMSVILWSIDTMDWRYRNTASILQHLRNQLQPGGIILMHDLHSTSVDAVPAVLDELWRQGYVVVSLQDLLGTAAAGKSYSQRPTSQVG